MKYSVVDIDFSIGDENIVENIELEEGVVRRVALFINDKPSSDVKIQLKGTEGEIHPFISYQEFLPANGGHLASRKELTITGGRKIKVTATADFPLTGVFKAQLLFYIEPKEII